MKNPKKPTYEQRKLIQKWGLDPMNWFVVKDTSTELVLIHRHSNQQMKTINKKGSEHQ